MLFTANGVALEHHVMHTLKSFYYNTEVEVGVYGYKEDVFFAYPQHAVLRHHYRQLLDGLEETIQWDEVKAEQTFSKILDQDFYFYMAPIRSEGALMGIMVAGPVLLKRLQYAASNELYHHAVIKAPPRQHYLSQLMHQIMKTSLYIGPHEALEQGLTFMTQKDMALEVTYGSMVTKVSYIVDQVLEGKHDDALETYKKSLLIGNFTDYEAEHAITAIKQNLMTIEALLSHRSIVNGIEPWKISEIKNPFYHEVLTLSDYGKLSQCGISLLNAYRFLEKIPDEAHLNECVKKATYYIQEHFREPISVMDICAFANVSKSTLSRYYKEHMHMTLGHAISLARVNYAKHLLKHSDMSLLSIALDSGFENQNYFTTVFKRLEGLTPSRYRMMTK